MVQRCGCVNRNVSSMYFRKRSDRTGGCAGDWLRVSIFYSYSGGGSFRRAGGWRKAFVSAVSDERCHLSGACVFDGASVLGCIVCRNRAGFIRGRSVQRRWVYASGCWTEKVEPTAASLLLSMESVFSVLAGWVILGQKLSARELFGCALVFAAVICVQLPDKKKAKQVETA